MIRQAPDATSWKGKLVRFRATLDDAVKSVKPNELLTPDSKIHVHHYIATAIAESSLRERLNQAASTAGMEWVRSVELSFGTVLPSSLQIAEKEADLFSDLVRRYYDPSIENRHSEVSGEKSMMWGYRKCGLPLVFEHNTPNNSLPILWADTQGDPVKNVHAMRPLFPRRQRHS